MYPYKNRPSDPNSDLFRPFVEALENFLNSREKLKILKRNSITQAKNSRFRQIHLVYLPKIGRKKKPEVISNESDTNYNMLFRVIEMIYLMESCIKSCIKSQWMINCWSWLNNRRFHLFSLLSTLKTRIEVARVRLSLHFSLYEILADKSFAIPFKGEFSKKYADASIL